MSPDWARLRVLAGAVVPLLLVVLAGAGILADRSNGRPAHPTCLSGRSDRIQVTGSRSDTYSNGGLDRTTVVDARNAHWSGEHNYAVELSGDGRVCLSGGRIKGQWPSDTGWKTMHGTGAVLVDAPGATVEDLRVDAYGDSIRLLDRTQNFLVRRVHLSYSRDDCIENDWLHSGTVRDSLLDGCYNAFSSRSYDGQDNLDNGDHNTWTIKNTLVRLRPMPRPYEDKGRIPGTAGFFKWDDHGPKLSLTGNVFRADQPANTVGLTIPPGKLAHCSHNVMVWLGRGPYPGRLPSCFKVTRDVRVWDRAVARWTKRYGS